MDRRHLAPRRAPGDPAARISARTSGRPGRVREPHRRRPGDAGCGRARPVRGDPSLRRRKRPRRADPHRVDPRAPTLTGDIASRQYVHRRGRRRLRRRPRPVPSRRARPVDPVVRRRRLRRRPGAEQELVTAVQKLQREWHERLSAPKRARGAAEQCGRLARARVAAAPPRAHRAGCRGRARHPVEVRERSAARPRRRRCSRRARNCASRRTRSAPPLYTSPELLGLAGSNPLRGRRSRPRTRDLTPNA